MCQELWIWVIKRRPFPSSFLIVRPFVPVSAILEDHACADQRKQVVRIALAPRVLRGLQQLSAIVSPAAQSPPPW